jgi:diacylglycerol O-acyltransferase
MHVAALVVLGFAGEGASSQGSMSLELLRATMGQRLHRVPRLRQVLSPPRRGWGAPVWADDQRFDINQHVQERCVPPPGDEAQLLRTCANLNAARLDRTRPLWQIWLLPGLPEGRTALLVRLHHAVADGVAAVSMLRVLLDNQGSADPRPGRRLASPSCRGWRPRAVTVRQVARDGRTPRPSLNVPVGAGCCSCARISAASRTSRTRTAAPSTTCFLTAIAGGARCLLQARGELKPGLEVKASVASSLRLAGEPPAPGNQVGVLVVPLRIDIAEPARLLAHIAATTAERKRVTPYSSEAGWRSAGWFTSCAISALSTCWSATCRVRRSGSVSRAHPSSSWRSSGRPGQPAAQCRRDLLRGPADHRHRCRLQRRA